MRREEQSIQKAVVMYLRVRYPNVIFTSAPANAKSPRQGKLNKEMGYCKGFPDLFIAHPRMNLHGLFLELKSPTGSVRNYQSPVHKALRDLNYAVIVCKSYNEATEVIDGYLK